MDKKRIIKSAEIFAKKCLNKEGTGHDWWHIKRVENNAKAICKSEKADWFTVYLAILLHDIGDRKVIKKDEDDYTIAKQFLIKQRMPVEIIDKIMFIVENISFSKSLNNKNNSGSKEFYVAQDADRLDALGAIGIARAFAYGGSKSRPIYDPTKKAQKINTTKNYRKLNSSTLHHFKEKILLLKDLMNTKAGKKIAEDRHNYTVAYLKQFLAEWHGKK